jgi:cell wall-associated NlpC family hydrolase
MRWWIVLFSMLGILAWSSLTAVQAAQAAPAVPSAALAQAEAYGGSWQGNAALDWAEAHAAGCWYVYGGSGPCSAGYDCSGLVMAAFAAVGISLPHSMYAMLAGNPHLHRVPLSQSRRGDLLFYGSGHVEIDTIWHDMSFGAHDTGSRVGWITWGPYWAPTMAFEVS